MSDPNVISHPSDRLADLVMRLSLQHYTPEAARRIKKLIDIQTVVETPKPDEQQVLRMRWYAEAPRGTFTEIKESAD